MRLVPTVRGEVYEGASAGVIAIVEVEADTGEPPGSVVCRSSHCAVPYVVNSVSYAELRAPDPIIKPRHSPLISLSPSAWRLSSRGRATASFGLARPVSQANGTVEDSKRRARRWAGDLTSRLRPSVAAWGHYCNQWLVIPLYLDPSRRRSRCAPPRASRHRRERPLSSLAVHSHPDGHTRDVMPKPVREPLPPPKGVRTLRGTVLRGRRGWVRSSPDFSYRSPLRDPG